MINMTLGRWILVTMVICICMSVDNDFLFDRPDAVIDPWLKEFWQTILSMYPLPQGIQIISKDIV